MAKGAAWTVLLRFAVRGIGFVSTLILARLLVPEDFGLVAMATSVIALIDMFGDFGFHVFLVQKEELKKDDLDTAWTVQLGIAILQAVILSAIAIPLGWFYEDQRLPPIVWVLAGTVLITGFKNIGVINFQRDMQFHLDFYWRATSKFIGFMVTVALAFAFRSYWALVAGSGVLRFAETTLSYLLQPHRPRLRLAGCGEIFNFSKWIYCNTTLNFFNKRSPDFVVGRIAGASSLGLFSMAYDIAMLPTTEMVSPINRATFPGYAKIRNDASALRDGYLSVLGIIALISLPAGFGIAAIAEILVPVLLGEKWFQAIPLIKILALVGALMSLQTNASAVFMGQGKPWVNTWVSLARISVLVPCLIFFTLSHGAIGAALAYLITSIMISPVQFYVIIRSLRIHIKSLLDVLYKPLVSSIVMYYILINFMNPIVINLKEAYQFLGVFLLALAGGLTYIFCEILIWIIFSKSKKDIEYIVVNKLCHKKVFLQG